tara:strand:- start:556 stop:690 length:135 start_codon:yes stop_codon:yes gene_type:complete
MTISLEKDQLKVMTKGEATIELHQMISLLHELVDEFSNNGSFEE